MNLFRFAIERLDTAKGTWNRIFHRADKTAFALEIIIGIEFQGFIEVFTFRQVKMRHAQAKADIDLC